MAATCPTPRGRRRESRETATSYRCYADQLGSCFTSWRELGSRTALRHACKPSFLAGASLPAAERAAARQTSDKAPGNSGATT